MQKALLFGTGAIGGGVILPRLVNAGFTPVVVARNSERRHQLLVNGLVVEVVGQDYYKKDRFGLDIDYVILEDDDETLAQIVNDPDLRLICTAVGSANLEVVARVIQKALAKQDGRALPPIAMMAFENLEQNGLRVNQIIKNTGSSSQRDVLCPTTVVDCMSFRNGGNCTIIREQHEEVIISHTENPELDQIINRINPLRDHQENVNLLYDRKFHLVSAIHTATAWIGILFEMPLVNQAANDPRFQLFLYGLIEEMSKAVAWMGGKFYLDELGKYGQKTLRRAANTKLTDHSTKFLRKLPSKVSTVERFGKPAITLFDRHAFPQHLCVILGLGVWLEENRMPNTDRKSRETVLREFPKVLSDHILTIAENPVEYILPKGEIR